MSSNAVPLPKPVPTHVPVPPLRLTNGTEALSGLIDSLLPDARSEFLAVDPAAVQPYADAIYRCDEVADALMGAVRRTRGVARRQFEEAVEHGIETVADPLPEVTAFFDTVDDVPPGIDMDLVERGARVLRRIDPVTLTGTGWPLGFLLAGILANPARLMVANKRSITQPGHRLVETTDYVRKAYAPGGYRRFGDGAKTAIRLRLLHSAIRLNVLDQGGWDVADLGYPASHADTLGGALPHTYWSMLAAERSGYVFSDDEKRAVAEYSACGLFRHGVPADLIPRTPAEIRLVTYFALRSANGFVAPEATARLMPYMADMRLPFLPQILQPAGAHLLNAYGRRILGDPICEATGIPDTPMRHVVGLFTVLIGAEDRARRAVPLIDRMHTAAMEYVWNDVLDKVFTVEGDAAEHLAHVVVKAS